MPPKSGIYLGLINLSFKNRFLFWSARSLMTTSFSASQRGMDGSQPTSLHLTTRTSQPWNYFISEIWKSETYCLANNSALSSVPFPYFPQTHLPASARPVLLSPHPTLSVHQHTCLYFFPTQPGPHDQDFQPHSHQQPRPFYTLPIYILHESNHDFLPTCPRLPLCWRKKIIALLTGQVYDFRGQWELWCS